MSFLVRGTRRSLGAVLAILVTGCGGAEPDVVPVARGAATFVGSGSCASCHATEMEAWRGSHHDLAMQEATGVTVLADFDTSVSYDGQQVRFERRDAGFWLQAPGPDGAATDYRVDYIFGVEPLQQYLVQAPGGRYQALGLAWDTRPRAQGGQRWFDLYPEEELAPGDELHWTGRQQNWNFMCAECHSTDLRKNYDPDRDRYETTWAEIDVACEACHGPGSNHVAWAREHERGEDVGAELQLGLVFALGDNARAAAWDIDPSTGLARRSPELATRSELETCGRCHARRAAQTANYEYGKPLADTHRVSLLEQRLYHADGQIDDEVYVYGSFLQSRMYTHGVTCSDCHDPHTARIYATGNSLCNRCHLAAKFDSPEHHFHSVATPGALCVDCHMPTKTYMVLDDRRDHSLRIPRPDLTASIGTPNACQACHSAQGDSWVLASFEERYGHDRPLHYGEVLAAARRGDAGAARQLVELANDWEQPGIARATALAALAEYPSTDGLDAIRRALNNDAPLIRAAGLQSLRTADAQLQLALALPALRDRVLSVRLAATRVLTGLPFDQLPAPSRRAILAAIEELESSLRVNADRPEALVNLGAIYAQTGRAEQAESTYRRALEMAPERVPAYVNMADLYRATGRDAEGEVLLRRAVAIEPESSEAHHALGLLLVRRNQDADAVLELGRAWELRGDVSRYALAYALALRQHGDLADATSVMQTALARNPRSLEMLNALVMVSRDAGRLDQALEYARRMAAVAPQDPGVLELVRELEEAR